MASAEDHNAAGNKCYTSRDFDGAYRHYSKAIKADSSTAKYWSNRANTLWRLGRTRQVIEDADAAIEADPTWVKGYYFKDLALEKLGDLGQAIQALQQGAKVDPDCTDVTEALHRCREAKDARRLKETHASTQAFCNDPAKSQQKLQQALQGLTSHKPTPRQLQQLQQLHSVHQYVMQADSYRYGSPANLPKAAQFYRKAAELGSASGQFNYAQMIKHRQIADQPMQAAMPWLLKPAAQDPSHPALPNMPNVGVVEAWTTLGDMHRDGLTGLTGQAGPDYAAALSWYTKAAEHGCAMAQNNIGQLHASGSGVARDAAAAAVWYHKAADQGYGVAEYNLAALLHKGEPPGVPQDAAAALEMARRAHKHGVAEAAALLSLLEPSCSAAAAKLREAAEAGDPLGCYLLPQASYSGLHGCERDLSAARKWLEAAAVSGKLPAAQLQLGLAYETGEWGCEVRPLKAISLIEKAAYQGLDQAQLKAARCHMYGTKPDLSKAKQWAQKAADQGCKEAQELLQDLQGKQGKDKAWARTVRSMHADIPAGAGAAESGDILLEKMLSSSSSMPDAAKTAMRQLHERWKQSRANPTSMFTPLAAGQDRFPMEQLLQYEDSPAVQPYIKARACMYAGLMALQDLTEQDDLRLLGTALQALAKGYALCHRVMRVPNTLLEPLELYMKQHPADPAAQLVHVYMAAPMRGPAWAEKRLGQVLPLLPKDLYPHVLLTRAEMRCWEQIGDYTGALKDAESGLKLLPGNPDLLYVRAYAKFQAASDAAERNHRRGRLSSSSRAGEASTAAVRDAFRSYLDAAPVEHLKRPHAHYFLAIYLLGPGSGRANDAAVSDEVQALYEAGQAAEAQLPPFFLPVQCGVRESVMPLLALQRASIGMSSQKERGGSSSRATATGRGAGAASSSGTGAGSSSGPAAAADGIAGSTTPGAGAGGAGNAGGSVCSRCGAAAAAKLMQCSRCKAVRYCSKECQIADWRAGHAGVCGK